MLTKAVVRFEQPVMASIPKQSNSVDPRYFKSTCTSTSLERSDVVAKLKGRHFNFYLLFGWLVGCFGLTAL